jgi:hypothetical protein
MDTFKNRFYLKRRDERADLWVSRLKIIHGGIMLPQGMCRHCNYIQEEEPAKSAAESVLFFPFISLLKKDWLNRAGQFTDLTTHDDSRTWKVRMKTAILLIEMCEVVNTHLPPDHLPCRVKSGPESKFAICVPKTTKLY